MNEDSSEELLNIIIDVYNANNQEISMIECLRLIIDETDLSEEEMAKLLDEQTKIILKENAAKHNMFRKSFYQQKTNVLDI